MELRIKFNEKGTISLFGLRRLPVTFWQNEWMAIAGILPQIVERIKENQEREAKWFINGELHRTGSPAEPCVEKDAIFPPTPSVD